MGVLLEFHGIWQEMVCGKVSHPRKQPDAWELVPPGDENPARIEDRAYTHGWNLKRRVQHQM